MIDLQAVSVQNIIQLSHILHTLCGSESKWRLFFRGWVFTALSIWPMCTMDAIALWCDILRRRKPFVLSNLWPVISQPTECIQYISFTMVQFLLSSSTLQYWVHILQSGAPGCLHALAFSEPNQTLWHVGKSARFAKTCLKFVIALQKLGSRSCLFKQFFHKFVT